MPPPAVRPQAIKAAALETLALKGAHTSVEWRRSVRARRVSLRIDLRRAVVVVTLPPRVGRRAGLALLMSQADWVSQRLAALPGATPLVDGSCILLDGVEHRVRHTADRRGSVWVESGEIVVAGAPEFVSRRLVDFLRAEARVRLTPLVQQKARLASVTPHRVTVKDTRSRWGSCASSRNLAFSWRLVMAPGFVQDYVAAHEVAHLRHMNHGPQFWALVDGLTEHRLRAMAWLRREGPKLLRVG